jgi:hypothetical protein
LTCANLCNILDESSRCLTCASKSLIFSRASSLSPFASSSSFSFSLSSVLNSSSSASSFLIFSAAGEGAPFASGRVPARAVVLLAGPPTDRAERELPGRAAAAPVPVIVEGRVGLVVPSGRVTVPVAGGAPVRAEADDRAAVALAGGPTGRVKPPVDGPDEEVVVRIGLAVETIPLAGRPDGRERPVVAVGAAEEEDVEDASEDRRGRVGPAETEGRRVLDVVVVVALPEVETGRPPAGTGRAVKDAEDEEARGRRAAVGPAAPEADIEDRRGALVVPAVAVPAARVGPVAFEARMAPPPAAAPRPMVGRAVELVEAEGRVVGFCPPTVGGLRAAPADAVGSLAAGVGEVGSSLPPAAGTVGEPSAEVISGSAAGGAVAFWSAVLSATTSEAVS